LYLILILDLSLVFTECFFAGSLGPVYSIPTFHVNVESTSLISSHFVNSGKISVGGELVHKCSSWLVEAWRMGLYLQSCIALLKRILLKKARGERDDFDEASVSADR
jgi:hypothetical protein